MSRGLLFIAFILFMFATSCKKLPVYPDVPVLEYKSLSFGQDALGPTFTLTATFTDGDGDVGYNADGNGAIFDSSSSPYYNNFVITLSILHGNVWQDTIWPVSNRLPYLTPTGANKS